MTEYILGLDPGGASRRGYGWVLVERTGKLPPKPFTVVAAYFGKCGDAAAALNAAAATLQRGGHIVAVGIDAPLGYDTGADRWIDEAIRKAINLGANQPMKVNSLRGAGLAQGQIAGLLIRSLRRKSPWSDVKVISESYPRAVRVLSSTQYQPGHCNVAGCDICDASLAALSAWAAYDSRKGNKPNGWTNWHTITVGGRPLLPEFMIVPDHEYWLPTAVTKAATKKAKAPQPAAAVKGGASARSTAGPRRSAQPARPKRPSSPAARRPSPGSRRSTR